MATKVRPIDRIRKTLEEVLTHGSTTKEVVDQLMVLGFQDLAQRLMDAEAEEHIGIGWHAHADASRTRRGYRNGYKTSRIKSSLGRIEIHEPRVRGSKEAFHSKVKSWMKRKTANLIHLVVQGYIRGLSTRDIAATFVDEDGRPLLSRQSISTLTDELDAEYQAFHTRRFDTLDVVYLFIDGVYESVRDYTGNQALLAAWAICADGHKEILDLAPVASESEEAWVSFLEGMEDRGLRHPLLVITDGGKGAHAAIAHVFPNSDRQRCIIHKMRNLEAKVPKHLRTEIHAQARDVYYAADRITAEVLAAQFIERHSKAFPAMVACFMDDLHACLTHLNYPIGHRQYIRTTNLIERAFGEQKRRTKTIPTFPGERSVVKLVYAVLITASKSWNKVSMTKLELQQLKALRHIKSTDDTFISFKKAA